MKHEGRDAGTISSPEIDLDAVERISCECSLAPLTARVLVARGIDTPQAVHEFLSPSLERDWRDPDEIPGLADVADKIISVMEAQGRILIFGDFDVDGISATAVGVRGLRELGADAVGLIPHRYDEGYALSEKAVKRAMESKPDLIVTVDCGISCAEEVAAMTAAGIDVAITDHHEAGEDVPQGIPVADPKLVPDHPSRGLAGAGVALKLICLLGRRLGKPDVWRSLTDLATLGTVSDLMPLKGENRALVADGISHIQKHPRTCLAALAATCNVEPADISATRLSFSLIPRMNAAGRMGDATLALDLLLCDDLEQAEKLASKLDDINGERRRVEMELAEQVEESLAKTFDGQAVIIAAGEGWHEGVKGIVASRIARSYKRPAIVFTIEDGIAHGSGRTYNGINLYELASSASSLFDKFGGHAAAIGITLPAARLPELEETLCAKAQALQAEGFAEEAGVPVDSVVKLSECTVEGFNELELLAPFGNANPALRLAAEHVFLERKSAVGKQHNHFRYTASDGIAEVAGIWFSAPGIDDLLSCDCLCDVVFEPQIDTWQGRTTAKLMTCDILASPSAADAADVDAPEIAGRVQELFSHESEILEVGEYANIAQLARFHTKVVGVTFENRQAVLSELESGVELALRRQPDNEMDPHAISVELFDGTRLGYLNRHLALRIAPVMDSGVDYDAAVTSVTGGPAPGEEGSRNPGPLGVRDPGVVDRAFGLNIVVRRCDLDVSEDDNADEGAAHLDVADELKERRQELSRLGEDELFERLRTALIGENALHQAQAEALDSLAGGKNTLVVMATGRGKSLIFHLHAARTALCLHKASIFVYPLRALVADQSWHLSDSLSKLGLRVEVLTGETDMPARDEIYEGLSCGEVDIVLTTPEYVCIHAEELARTESVGFCVVDEAHHIGLSRAGNRPAYAELGAAFETLGRPLVLAVTATAGDDTADLICSTLAIDARVLDPSIRDNLHLDDRRDLKSREDYLATLVSGGDKTIVYVNSREQTMKLTRMLRHRLPGLACRMAFYNAGLSKQDRLGIEEAFRKGDLRVIVSTSAFGEGIDIPDIDHVVLFHLPFNDIEFNQMSGRAGRSGDDAYVHLLYSYADARINEKILGSSAPSRNALAALYRVLRELGRAATAEGQDSFSVTNAELSDRVKRSGEKGMDPAGVSCGISVFRELGFLDTSGRGVYRRIHMATEAKRMELTDSVRYREGLEEIEGFGRFKTWALSAKPDELLARFNRPILPTPSDLKEPKPTVCSG